jgi:hypothetical protein
MKEWQVILVSCLVCWAAGFWTGGKYNYDRGYDHGHRLIISEYDVNAISEMHRLMKEWLEHGSSDMP